MIIIGKNPVFEAVNAKKCKKIFVRKGSKFNVKSFLNVPYEYVENGKFDKEYGKKSQGIAAEIDFNYEEIEDNLNDIVRGTGVVVLDQINDPQNFGAIIRAAHCFGIRHIIVAKDNQAKVTHTVFKASAGSLLYMKIINVTNLARTLDLLKNEGIRVYAADIRGEGLLNEIKVYKPFAVIIGSEGKGIRHNVLKRADTTFKIPMTGKIDSLNASQSASIVLYEFTRLLILK